jgi:hypothetical protein
VRDLWLAEWQWDWFISEYLGFPLLIILPVLHTHEDLAQRARLRLLYQEALSHPNITNKRMVSNV